MEEKNKQEGVKSTSKQLTAFCDVQGEKAMDLVKKSVPAVEEYAKDPAKLNKVILIINLAATALMLLAFYVLPALPALKGNGSMTLSETLKLFNNIPSGAQDVPMKINLMMLIGNVLLLCTYANLFVGLYSLLTEKVIPYVSSRLFSLISFISMFLLFIVVIGDALSGIYIALLASIVVGFSGLVMISKK
ncbi:MAG: hypothetical protein R3Y26_08925 [Rikenellaceae bacterium]